MVHQHFMLVPVFTVAENVVLGVEPTGALDHLDMARARQQVREISAEHGLEVDPDAVIEEVPVGIQQRVEIIKVLFRSASVLIFDEPTAVLTPQEVTEFFGIVRSLRDAGKALVFITHKLHEVLEVADRISVLRAGRIVASDPKTATSADLAEMVGRRCASPSESRPRPAAARGEGLTVLNERDEIAVRGVGFTVHEARWCCRRQGNSRAELVERSPATSYGRRHGAFAGGTSPASTRERHRLIRPSPGTASAPGCRRLHPCGERRPRPILCAAVFGGIRMHWQDMRTVPDRQGFRRQDRIDPYPRRQSLGRQPAEARRRPRDGTRHQVPDRRAADRSIDVGSIEYIRGASPGRDEGDGISARPSSTG
jgi:simple sugar transport system ATP-binding protein